jgi:hypothetical protein
MTPSGDPADGEPGVVKVSAQVRVDADRVWQSIGAFETAGEFLDVASTLISGNGLLGSERRVGESVIEKMVAQGRRFYAYVQTAGPMAHTGYHGCVGVDEDNAQGCTIVYTLVYDEQAMEPATRTSERRRLTDRFQSAVESMARRAESG